MSRKLNKKVVENKISEVALFEYAKGFYWILVLCLAAISFQTHKVLQALRDWQHIDLTKNYRDYQLGPNADTWLIPLNYNDQYSWLYLIGVLIACVLVIIFKTYANKHPLLMDLRCYGHTHYLNEQELRDLRVKKKTLGVFGLCLLSLVLIPGLGHVYLSLKSPWADQMSRILQSENLKACALVPVVNLTASKRKYVFRFDEYLLIKKQCYEGKIDLSNKRWHLNTAISDLNGMRWFIESINENNNFSNWFMAYQKKEDGLRWFNFIYPMHIKDVKYADYQRFTSKKMPYERVGDIESFRFQR